MAQTLLLADDSVTIQRVIELTFADEDITVVAVSDGDQAIASIEASPPDIVLADIGMPGRNGYEVARHIKQSPRLAHIPVLLLTGAFEPVDQAKAAEAGCDGVLAKPFEPQLVIQRVKELLARSRPTSPGVHEEDDEALVAPAPVEAAPSPKAPASAADVANYFDRLDAAFANLPGPGASAPIPVAPPAAPAIHVNPGPPSAGEDHDAIDIDWFGDKPEAASELPPDFSIVPDPDPVAALRFEPVIETAIEPAVDEQPDPLFEPEPQLEMEPASASEPASEATREPEPPVVQEAVHALDVELPADALPKAPEEALVAPPAATASMVPLADAFAALLTAEQRVGAAVWPAASSPVTPGPIAPPPPPPVDLDALAANVTRRVLDDLSARVDDILREEVADRVSQIAERLVREEIERLKATIE